MQRASTLPAPRPVGGAQGKLFFPPPIGHKGRMLAMRSLLFNLAFYVTLIVLMVAGLPAFLMTRFAVYRLASAWGRSSLFLLDKICGLKVEFRGLENIPSGGFVIAPKHQSIWETFALLSFFPEFSFVLKRELSWIPLFGWYTVKAEQIAIDRSAGGSALSQVTRRTADYVVQGRQVFLFPEGTRRPAGARPSYKLGIAHVCCKTGARCLPVALNSGLYWPRRSFLRRPGTVLVEFLPVMEPGPDKQAFLARLRDTLEAATDRLLAEAVAANPAFAGVLAAAASAAPAKAA